MNSKDPRQKNRRQSERRSMERRVISHPFNSPEWINEIQQAYLLWPKKDRRVKDRRSESRRQNHRRSGRFADVPPNDSSKKMYDLLTNEEKQMLNELAQTDDLD